MTASTLKNRICFLSGNVLKIIAAISMVIDHIGVMFFPYVKIYRILGRLAYPIFAFMIAEGCKYTKNKLKYFLTIFVFAIVIQLVYYLYSKDTYMSILITFSLSILIVFALQNLQKSFVTKDYSLKSKIFSALLFAIAIALTVFMNIQYTVDYGILGCVAPAFASLVFSFEGSPEFMKKVDLPFVRVLLFSIALVLLSIYWGGNQFYCLLAIPLLLLYSGKRGKLKMKYFFYAFYPAHLLLLELINFLIA